MKQKKILGFILILLLTSSSYARPDDTEDRYLQARGEQLQLKQAQAEQLNGKIEALQQQISRDRAELKSSNEKIWKEFSDSLEVERRDLQEKMGSIGQRQAQFESELARKQNQDEIGVREKEAEIKRLMSESERLRKELEVDRKSFGDLKSSAKVRQEKAPSKSSAPPKGDGLENGAIQIARAPASQILGHEPMSAMEIHAEYHLSMGDILSIDVWRNPDLSRRASVRPDGRISYPLVGDVEVVGMTLVDLRTMITEKLAEYIRNPQVTISVEGFGGRKFIILGEVNSPGVYRYQESISLVEAIALAGGFQKDAHTGKVLIVRGDIHKTPQVKVINANAANIFKQGMISENLAIVPNDIIYVGKDFLGDYRDVINDLIDPSMNQAINFFVLRSAIRTAQDRRN